MVRAPRLAELTIPGRHGFDHSERSYSSAVSWARGKLGCTQKNICETKKIYMRCWNILLGLQIMFWGNVVKCYITK